MREFAEWVCSIALVISAAVGIGALGWLLIDSVQHLAKRILGA